MNRELAGRHSASSPDGAATLSITARPSWDGRSLGQTQAWLDGHLYNASDLARELRLPEQCDAETIVRHAYREWGAGMLARFRGDFVVVCWDARSATGLIGRDHLGGRSLFWSDAEGDLLFASELNLLLPMLRRRPAPDSVSLVQWMALRGPPDDRTFYEGVRQLAPGHYIALTRAGRRVDSFWRPTYTTPARIGFTDAADVVRERIAEAVDRRTQLRERTGVLLSGGIDSAVVAATGAALARPGRRPSSAWSATFPDDPVADEAPLIGSVARSLDLPATAHEVRGGSVVAGATEFLETWGVPPTSPNLFFWLPLLRRARAEGVTAMLDGEGGDALFWLSPHAVADRLAHGRLHSAVRLARRVHGAGDDGPDTRTTLRILRAWGVRGLVPPTAIALRRRARGAGAYAPSFFSASSARTYVETTTEHDWRRLDGPRWWRSLAWAATGLGSTLLHDGARRRGAMAGVDSRHPLLDVDVVETVLSLPPELAFDPRHSRPLLREAVRGLVPDDVRLRKSKSHFDSVFHGALSGRDLDAVRAYLGDPGAEVGAYVDGRKMREQLIDRPPGVGVGLQTWALHVWRLLTAELWLRRESGETDEPRGEIRAPTSPFSDHGPGTGQLSVVTTAS